MLVYYYNVFVLYCDAEVSMLLISKCAEIHFTCPSHFKAYYNYFYLLFISYLYLFVNIIDYNYISHALHILVVLLVGWRFVP